jgi:hypothetical protein
MRRFEMLARWMPLPGNVRCRPAALVACTLAIAFLASFSAQANPAAWSIVFFPGVANQVELALPPAGKPRLLYKTDGPSGPCPLTHNYAACDGGCTNPAALTVVTATSPLHGVPDDSG